MEHYEMERIAPMKIAIEEKANALISDRMKEIEKLLADNTDNIRSDLEAALKGMAGNRVTGSLAISFLRSSYISRSHEFYIAYYEDIPFVEEDPDCISMNFRPILKGMEEDLREIDDNLQKNFIRVFAGEKEEIHRWYMERVYISLGNILKMAVGKIEGNGKIPVCYGGYMEELGIIGAI